MKTLNRAALLIAISTAFSVVATPVLANDASAPIEAAIAAGQANVGLVVAGVVAVAALAFGLGMIKSWLSK